MGINAPLNRKLRMALVGGGAGSFIGRVHSIAACLDNRAAVTAGALSSNPERSKASAPDYDIDQSRAYGSYEAMLDAESKVARQTSGSISSASRRRTTRTSKSLELPSKQASMSSATSR